MGNYPKKAVFILFILNYCFFLSHSFGQQSDSLFISAKDSLLVKDSLELMLSDVEKEFPKLDEMIRKGKTYSLRTNQIRIELEEKLDTLRFSEEIPEMENTLVALERRVKTPNTQFNFRYIFALNKILGNIEESSAELDLLAQSKMDRLKQIDSMLNEIKKDDFFQFKIRDSTLLPSYSKDISTLKRTIQQLDSTLFRQEIIAARFQARISEITISLLGLRRYLDTNKSFLEKNLLKKEINYIWESYKIPSPKSIFEITIDSVQLNYFILKRQLTTKPIPLILALLIVLGGLYGVRNTVQKISEDKEYGSLILSRTKYLEKSALATTMVALLPFVFFMFDTESITVLTFFIYLQVLFSSILIFRYFPVKNAWKWLLLVLIFLFVSISNLYWEIAYQERMYFLVCNLIYVFILWRIPEKFQSEDPKEALFLLRLRNITLAFLALSLLANSLGRFSLAKIFTVSATIGFVYGVCLYFFLNASLEIIYVIMEKKKSNDSFTSFLDYQNLQKKIKDLLLLIAFSFWIIILLYNLALSNYVIDKMQVFLSAERSLGDSTFTFGSIFLFLGIVYLSFILSNYISYFITFQDQKQTESNTKKLGSSILLIRLGILALGFFIAITAAKIPLDRITLVLGALSVGIGFGLQTIINNLVSGVILAFERPIQIGDDIEVGTLTGKVKEVGIRASKIQAYDGSEIVVPNGDLLSKSLINWTLSDKKRRIELLIGVSYDSDMDKTRQLLEKVLDRENVLKYPAPRVLMQNFNQSSVDFRILFWIESVDLMLEVRNQVMNDIFRIFKENHIEIPYPKSELYIKSISDLKNINANED